ncbi:MAG: sigma-54-dependent Fis family transcriptional regulator [Magnetococcales bacterium]|nr:sigma-54-dependent Fis family transcriptional regulator [Magnetococcales bacterium]
MYTSTSTEISRRLETLKSLLERIHRSWGPKDFEALMRFFVEILPRLTNAERCSIFVADQTTENIWLKFGTGLEEKAIIAPMQGSLVGESISTGQTVIQTHLDQRAGFHAQVDKKTEFTTRNLLCVPIHSLAGKYHIGAVELLNKRSDEGFTPEDEAWLKQLVKHLALSIEHNTVTEEIIEITRGMHREIARTSDSLLSNERCVAESRAMRQIMALVQQIGPLPVNVFITGESGAGKEVIARLIHSWPGERRTRPFVAVNCSSIPENLMESEFFGHEKGAFTGAANSRMGRFEEAIGGTLFLDEIAEMPLSIQPKFLRAIQEMEGVRLGGNKIHHYDFRIISASSKDLRDEVKAGRFREDLFFRLFSIDIRIPPLRERTEEILPLMLLFLEQVSKRFKKKTHGFSPSLVGLFESYSWPGNVRQLEHEVERLVALTPEGETITEAHCSPQLMETRHAHTQETVFDSLSLPAHRRQLEIDLIMQALKKAHGNKVRAAELLDITRQSLHNKIKLYQIEDS